MRATGKGMAQSQLGFETPVPDFSDCDFANREPDADWIAVAHQGGPVRGFAKDMPAFGKALSQQQLQQIMDHIRTLCRDDNWPRGELNMPRPLVTEKAYPEDEAVISTSIDIENEGNVMNELVYEQRFGVRNQLEIVVPFGFRESPTGNWNGGQLGDMALGVKRALYHNFDSGSIFSATGEVIFPTGDRAIGFGKGTTIFEPFLSFGQLLPANGFDKETADEWIEVHGDAFADEDFRGGRDQVTYRVKLPDINQPLQITAELWYQPIGFRWAQNLADYDAEETNRFVDYFDAMSGESAVRLTNAVAQVD